MLRIMSDVEVSVGLSMPDNINTFLRLRQCASIL